MGQQVFDGNGSKIGIKIGDVINAAEGYYSVIFAFAAYIDNEAIDPSVDFFYYSFKW